MKIDSLKISLKKLNLSSTELFSKIKTDDLYFIVGGRIAQALLSIALLRILTTLFEKDQIAQYYIIHSIIFFYTYVILGGFSVYFNRYLLEPSTHPYSLFTRYFRQVILFGLVGIPINMLLLKLLEANGGHLLIIISIIFFNVTLSAFLRNLLTSINIFQKVRFFVSFNLLALSLGLFLATLLSNIFGAQIHNWFLGIILGEILVFPLVYKKFKLLSAASSNASKRTFLPLVDRDVFNFCGPLVLTNLLIWVQLYAYRLITSKALGSDLLSDLAIALGVALAVFAMVEAVINQYFYPELLRNITQKEQADRVNAWSKLFKKAIIIYFFVGIFVIFCSKSLMIILTDEKFHQIYIITSLASIIELGRVINNIFLLLYQSEKRTELTIIPYFIGTFVLLACLSIFEIEASILNVIIALMLSQWCVTLYLLIRSKLQFKIDFTQLFKIKNKSLVISLVIFGVLMKISRLNEELTFHILILFAGLVLLVYLTYPYLEKKK